MDEAETPKETSAAETEKEEGDALIDEHERLRSRLEELLEEDHRFRNTEGRDVNIEFVHQLELDIHKFLLHAERIRDLYKAFREGQYLAIKGPGGVAQKLEMKPEEVEKRIVYYGLTKELLCDKRVQLIDILKKSVINNRKIRETMEKVVLPKATD